MASKQESSLLFRFTMIMLFFVFVIIMVKFFPSKGEKTAQVSKPVTMAKVVAKTEVANRVVRDLGDKENPNSNGAVNMKLDLGGISFDLKNSK